MIACITLKNITFKQFNIKNVKEETIYKKCGYKSSTNFKKLYTWDCDDNSKQIELWSKEDLVCKQFNTHRIFTKYSIKVNINNRCIFLIKSNGVYNNLYSDFFNSFFDIKETIENCASSENNNFDEPNTDDESVGVKNLSENNNDLILKNVLLNTKANKDDEDYEHNSELSYELYCYSDEECEAK